MGVLAVEEPWGEDSKDRALSRGKPPEPREAKRASCAYSSCAACMMKLGFRVKCLGCRVYGMGFRVWG